MLHASSSASHREYHPSWDAKVAPSYSRWIPPKW